MTTLVAITGPYPVKYGTHSRTTHNDIREMVASTPGADLMILPDRIDGATDIGWGITQMRNLAVQYGMDYHNILIVPSGYAEAVQHQRLPDNYE